eukprot:TRINITY_DN3655_c0_g1_i1.p1 TRINITY_DN3655_c0_g1~~TRINITY_DN3655_c0_g1_i1.p1  ORF type:complete len:578 (-),score=138.13 TRINITY_DN3655_c0_g1_i1:65-1798(-)
MQVGASSPSRSPLRAAEKEVGQLAKQVDELNSRLIAIFMARRAEQGNSSAHADRARDEILAALQQQIDETRISYSKQLEDVIKARDHERQMRLILESQSSDLKRKLDALKKSFDDEQAKNAGLEDSLSKIQDELAEKNALVLQLKSSNENLLMQVGNLKKKLVSLEAQLGEALQGADHHVDQLNYWKAKAQSAEQTHAALQEEHESSINRLEKEILLLRGTGEGLETRLRTDFARQLSEMIREKQVSHDQEKNRLLEDQRRFYEEKISQLRISFNERSDEVNAIIARSQEMETNNKVLSEKLDERMETIRALEARVSHQEALLEDLKNKPMFAMSKKDQEIRDLRQRLEIQDREMRELEEARIRLDKEIETYRTLLHEEEVRLQANPTRLNKESDVYSSLLQEEEARLRTNPVSSYHVSSDSPGPALNRKKRKIAVETTTASVQETRSTRVQRSSSPAQSPLRLGYEFRGNRFSVINQSPGDYNLSGWKVASIEAKFDYDLPNVTLGSGDQVTFWWGSANLDKHEPPRNIHLSSLAIPYQNETRVQLVSPDGTIVDSIILRKTLSASRRTSDNCIVM